MLRRLFVFLGVVSISLAALSIRNLDQKPEEFRDVPGCFIPELYEVIPVGGRKPSTDPAKCEEYICNEDNVQVATCGAVSANAPCVVVPGDVNSPHPGCCPTVRCPITSPCN